MQTPCLKHKITGSRDHLGAPCDGVINFTTDIQALGVAFCSIQTNQSRKTMIALRDLHTSWRDRYPTSWGNYVYLLLNQKVLVFVA